MKGIHMRTVQAVIFDWAGTMVDFGSRAPMGTFVAAFAEFGVTLTIDQARGPMGLPKRAHIAELFALPEIAAGWRAAQGADPDDGAIDRVLAAFVPKAIATAADYAALVPGAADMVAGLRARGIRIGSTTGYTRDIMAPILARAAAEGYAPDLVVCAGDLAAGRPTPLMMYRCFAELGVWEPHRVVKVDDTAPGIAEGRAAGCWCVGVAVSGNEAGLSLEAWTALTPDDQARVRARATAKIAATGAHLVIDTVADLPGALAEIEKRLALGLRP